MALKERTVGMIEGQVEEQRIRLQQDLKNSKMGAKKDVLHERLNYQREEYEHKMKIIEEIKRDKERQEAQELAVQSKKKKDKADRDKFVAQNFKDQRAIERLRTEQR